MPEELAEGHSRRRAAEPAGGRGLAGGAAGHDDCLTSTPGSPARPVTGSAGLAERLDDLASAESRAPHSSLPRPRTRHRVSALGASSRQPVREAAIGRAPRRQSYPGPGQARARALEGRGPTEARPQCARYTPAPDVRSTASARREECTIWTTVLPGGAPLSARTGIPAHISARHRGWCADLAPQQTKPADQKAKAREARCRWQSRV